MPENWTDRPEYLRILESARGPIEQERPGAGLIEAVAGPDGTRTLVITPTMARFGGRVRLERIVDCEYCGGAGVFVGAAAPKCMNCDGDGTLVRIEGLTRAVSKCPSCLGTGLGGAVDCNQCRTKANLQYQKLEFDVPAGTADETTIVLPGLGVAGRGGAADGALRVIFKVG